MNTWDLDFDKRTPVVIFGVKDLAQLAKFYLDTDIKYAETYRVVAFTVNKEYLPSRSGRSGTSEYLGLPVIPFETVEATYPPDRCKFFAPMTGQKMNTVREAVFNQGLAKGYSFISYISSDATVKTTNIGKNCFILEDNTIQPFVSIGDNVVIWSGCHIGHHSSVDDHTFFTSHVVLSGHCRVGKRSWFGVNSTIRDGLEIAESSLVGMGSVVTKNTEPYGTYVGVPAKKTDKSSLESNP